MRMEDIANIREAGNNDYKDERVILDYLGEVQCPEDEEVEEKARATAKHKRGG